MFRRHRNSRGVVVLVLLLSAASACGRGIDQAKFESVYRAGQGMKSATDVGVTLQKYRELLQVFASEVAMAEPKAANPREKAMVARWRDALVNYRDAVTLWVAKIEHGPTLPTTAIPEGPALIDTYRLPTEQGVDPAYRTFSVEAGMQTVWQKAAANIAMANVAYTGRVQ
jgi:hypothetical protein